MNLKLENENWEIAIDDSSIVEYDNYVDGFDSISEGEFQFDTIRVFISINKKMQKKDILAFPWKSGETYPEDEKLISSDLKNKIENLIKKTEFYQKVA